MIEDDGKAVQTSLWTRNVAY